MKKILNIKPIEASGQPGLPSFDAEVEGLPEGHVIANVELEGGEPELESIQIGEEKFALPQGGTPAAGLKLYKHVLEGDHFVLNVISAVGTEYANGAAVLEDATVISMVAVKKDLSKECTVLRPATVGHLTFVEFAEQEGAVSVVLHDVEAETELLADTVTEITNPVAKKAKK